MRIYLAAIFSVGLATPAISQVRDASHDFAIFDLTETKAYYLDFNTLKKNSDSASASILIVEQPTTVVSFTKIEMEFSCNSNQSRVLTSELFDQAGGLISRDSNGSGPDEITPGTPMAIALGMACNGNGIPGGESNHRTLGEAVAQGRRAVGYVKENLASSQDKYSTSIVERPAVAADEMKIGKDTVVIDGKNAFLNGKKISCQDLSNTVREEWGPVYFDENCVKRETRFVLDKQASMKLAYSEDQWLFRKGRPGPRAPDENPSPRESVAVLMDSLYYQILFRAHCEYFPELTISYRGDHAVNVKRGDTMTLLLGARPHKMSVRFVEDPTSGNLWMVGNIRLTAALKESIAVANEIRIDVPNWLGEPWYTGTAPALKRLVRECK